MFCSDYLRLFCIPFEGGQKFVIAPFSLFLVRCAVVSLFRGEATVVCLHPTESLQITMEGTSSVVKMGMRSLLTIMLLFSLATVLEARNWEGIFTRKFQV